MLVQPYRVPAQKRLIKSVRMNALLYAMLLPVLAWYLIFCYLPMGGVTLAFKSYKFNLGLWGSPWTGVVNFKKMIKDTEFWRAFKNTLVFSLGRLVFHFPVPIISAICMNEIRRSSTKKIFQTVFTFPHFISWVVLSGIFINMFSSNGVVIQSFSAMGVSLRSPLVAVGTFRPFIWISDIWKEFGWDMIIYMAALANLDPQLYEAADIDGAHRFQKMAYVTWPGILGVVCTMLILAVGGIMGGASFDQIFNLYSSPVYSVADIIDTFVYRQSFTNGTNFGYTTAVGLLKSGVGLIMITFANKAVTLVGEQGLF